MVTSTSDYEPIEPEAVPAVEVEETEIIVEEPNSIPTEEEPVKTLSTEYRTHAPAKLLSMNTAKHTSSMVKSLHVEESATTIRDTSIVPEEPTEFLRPGQYRTNKQNQYHEIAELARAAGLSEDSQIIQEAKRLWNQEQYDLNIMAKVGFNEAGGCEWQQLLDTLAVLKNRVDSPYWPNTVYEVVVAPYQYLEAYTHDFENVSARAYAAAVIIMNEEYTIPKNVVFQANFPQGSGTWRIVECNVGSFHSTTWFGYDLASREYPDD